MNTQFSNLVILDLANNHQGDLEHGLSIIDQLSDIVKKYDLNSAIKFQFRQLDSFIHPEYKGRKDVQHISRFESTNLDIEDYRLLIERVRNHNLITMCTPFDEASVALIQEMDIDIIKIASCSISDYPLIDAVCETGMPVVASTGGATLDQIEKVVNMFQRSKIDFALEHCVSLYPTPSESLQLNQIDYLRSHFPDIEIGWSTHEEPNDLATVQIAVAKGATLFERHVGLPTSVYSLNAYSSTPDQIDNWLASLTDAKLRCGSSRRSPASSNESSALRSLARGVYVARDVDKGDLIQRGDVYFAMPLLQGRLSSGRWRDGLTADDNYAVGSPLDEEIADMESSDEELVQQIMLQVQGMLHDARIRLNNESTVELSHHYGLRRFREFGAIIFNVINREYCKKLIVQLPRQKHPYHFHKKKEETFQVLYGELEVEKNGEPYRLAPGDLFLVEPENWHKFSTLDGVIFEEISTTHYDNDSFYEDRAISKLPRAARKTFVQNWNY